MERNLLGEEAAFFVAPDGNDAGAGSVGKPFATLTRARDAVRELKQGKTEGPITVLLRGGTYPLTETVVFGLEDSGTEGKRVTYAAFPGETPVFTSGIRVVDWRLVGPDDPGYSFLPAEARGLVYAAPIPEGIELIRTIVDHEAHWLERARIDVTDLVTTRHFKHCKMVESEMWDPPEEKRVQEYSESMEGLSNLDKALELRIYPTDYNMNLLPVDSIEGNRLRTAVPGTYRLAPPPPHHRPWKDLFEVCWIENVLEGLDAPGKWACNTRTGRIYLWPKAGTDRIEAPTLTELVRVEGSIDYWGQADVPVEHLTFEGITFTCGERAVWEEGDTGVQHDWGMVDKPNALLRFRGAESCAVKDCTFTKSGGVGVRFDLHAQQNSIEDCLFEYLGDEAVSFCGYGIGTKDVSKGNQVAHNEIHHIGQAKWDAPAIIIWNSGYNRVIENYIHDCPYKGVLLSAARSRAFTKSFPMREQGWPTARWNEVSSDAHSDIALQQGLRQATASDQVCSRYRFTRGNVVARNTLHDMSEGMWGDGIFYVTATASCTNPPEDCNKIISNYIYNSDGNSDETQSGFFRGLYLDSFMGNVEVHRNVWHNCAMVLEGNQFALSYGEALPRANVFHSVSHGGRDLLTGRRFDPQGTLVFGAADDVERFHEPRLEFLEDYTDVYNGLDSLPGVVRGREQVKLKLAQVIRQLGGVVDGAGVAHASR